MNASRALAKEPSKKRLSELMGITKKTLHALGHKGFMDMDGSADDEPVIVV
ncbi:MAG: hypothetical protein ACE361_14385 [Aureliella sp.]